jgi:hypothetical protein
MARYGVGDIIKQINPSRTFRVTNVGRDTYILETVQNGVYRQSRAQDQDRVEDRTELVGNGDERTNFINELNGVNPVVPARAGKRKLTRRRKAKKSRKH